MITFVHRIDQNNPGDYWSCPSHYFNFKNTQHLDMSEIKGYKTKNKIIFGGGGLLGRITWDNSVRDLVNNNNVILWGAGQNVYGQKKKGDMVGVLIKSQLPSYITDFEAIGLRDYDLGYNWVPCASCLHPVFAKAIKVKPKDEILGIEHNKIKLRSDNFKTINHAITLDQFEEFILTIANYNCVITNTYHGAYWSLLLGKKVIVQPWSSKFNNLKWSHETIGKGEQTSDIIFNKFESLSQDNQNALEEAIDANNNFYKTLSL